MRLDWSCVCGAMRGHLTPDGGTRLVCHCDSCVRAQRHFGGTATQADGVPLFQTSPDRFVITQGAGHLRLARLSPKGAYRWYAGCCQSPIGVTATTPRVAFVSLSETLIATPEALGPVRGHAFVPQAGGGASHKGIGRIVMALVARSGAALASGRWRQTPFFDIATGQPTAPVELLPANAGR